MERFDLENFPISESAKDMIASVSDGFYDNSYVGKWLYEVMGQEYDTAREIAEDLINQLFPETATWGLMYHEIKWGLPVRENLSYEERRQIIYRKRDYRAPMTPYRMEGYLKTATGFDVRIADITIREIMVSLPRTLMCLRHISWAKARCSQKGREHC